MYIEVAEENDVGGECTQVGKKGADFRDEFVVRLRGAVDCGDDQGRRCDVEEDRDGFK